jgi:DNA topoisomerase VI subunit B
MIETSRMNEYFEVPELERQTGQPSYRFAEVIAKELCDNALDASETARVPPVLSLQVQHGEQLYLTVQDNGGGISPDTVRRILNFDTRTSDKSIYRTPTRGMQDNATKTLIGIPYALGGREPLIIEACAVRHTILPWLDPANELHIKHDTAPCDIHEGTRISLVLPAEGQHCNPELWAQSFSLFNPHAEVRILEIDGPSEQC